MFLEEADTSSESGPGSAKSRDTDSTSEEEN